MTENKKMETRAENGTIINETTAKIGDVEYEVPEINYDDFRPIFNFDGMDDSQICVGACNKLFQDTYFGINGFPVLACFLWAFNKAKVDVEFAKKVCIKSKNFTKAFDYLRKTFQAEGKQGVDHREIFAVLEDYFSLDDAEVAKREAEAKAKREAERKAKAAESKKKASSKKDAPKAKKEDEEKSEKPEAVSLFDMIGGDDNAAK